MSQQSDPASAISPSVSRCWFGTGGGHHAELTSAPADIVTALPGEIDQDDAVCIPNYAIAWCLLCEVAPGRDDRIIYVNGASGGVGSAVVDLARDIGMTVIAGAGSADKCAFAAGLGADHTIDYSSEKVPERVLEITEGRGADLVLDQLIGPDFTDSIQMLAPLGTIVSFNALAGLPEKETFAAMRANLGKSPGVRCFSWHSFDSAPAERARILDRVVERFASGSLNPAIHARLPLSRHGRRMSTSTDVTCGAKSCLDPDVCPLPNVGGVRTRS